MNGVKTTIFLGAGATRGAIKGFHSNGKRILPPLNSDFLSIIKKFVASKNNPTLTRRLARLVRFIYENIGVGKTEVPTMEEIFSMLYSAKDFLDIYKSGPGRKPESLIEIEDFFELTVHLFHEIKMEDRRHNLYDKLVSLLEDGDAIITLNYDTLIESALLKQNWSPHKYYGLRLTEQKFKGFRRIESGLLKKVHLYKLHGSLNWFVRRRKKEDLLVLFSKKPAFILNPANLRLSEKDGYLRQIIPPIYGKFFAHKFWRSIWLESFEALKTSDQLIIIGCSLIKTDFHIRTFFSRVKAVKKNNSEYFRRVTVVDPDPGQQPLKRVKQVLRGSVRTFDSYRNFEEFISKSIKKQRIK